MNKVLPVLRYPGSKWGKAQKGKPNGWKVDKIISILNINKYDNFYEIFGGSGIIGVNVKNTIGANVIINDFDNVLPINDDFALKNLCSFQGMNKFFTKAANDYAIRRIKNGYWKKVDKYNDVLKKCKINKLDYKNVFKKIKGKTEINKFYVDPPYHGIKNLYKNSFNDNDHTYHGIKNLYKNSFNDNDHKILNSFLNNIKINNPKCKILISYNDTSFIRNLYKDWYIKKEEFQYQTDKLNRSGKKKKVNELFITNFKN